MMCDPREKRFWLSADEILPGALGHGACYASDMITVDGCKVGWMYRESPGFETDSGRRFFSGRESQEYADNSGNFAIYDVSTIANYDPEIVPFLDQPAGSAFERSLLGGRVRQGRRGKGRKLTRVDYRRRRP
jgi:hypothetical protein